MDNTNEEIESFRQEMIRIFETVMNKPSNFERNIIILRTLFSSSMNDIIIPSLKRCILCITSTNFKPENRKVIKLLKFLGASLTYFQKLQTDDIEKDEIMLDVVMNILLEFQCDPDDNMRYWSCFLLKEILNSLAGYEISCQICERLEKCMLERLKDRCVPITLLAIECLYRLQDPTESNNRIIIEFIDLINYHSNSKVRKVCIELVALRRDVIEVIIHSLRDMVETVRLAAWKRLLKIPRNLNIEQRRSAMKNALVATDSIKPFVKDELLPIWTADYDMDFIKFIEAFRFDANERDIEDTIKIDEFILKSLLGTTDLDKFINILPLNDSNVIPYDKLNWDSAIYWRVLVEHLRNKDYEITKILPDLVDFTEYIQTYCNKNKNPSYNYILEYEFILQQLFQITICYDVSDQKSRMCLNDLVKNTLISIEMQTQKLIDKVVKNLVKVMPDQGQHTLFINEIISEIIMPFDESEIITEHHKKAAQTELIKEQINEFKAKASYAMEVQDYARAEWLGNEISKLEKTLKDLYASNMQLPTEKRTDNRTILQCLMIMKALLNSDRLAWNGNLETMKNNVISEWLVHPNIMVNTKALECYSLCCRLDQYTARQGIHLLLIPLHTYRAGDDCSVDVLCVCIRGVVDILVHHGTKILLAEPTENLNESQKEDHLKIFTGGTSLTEIVQTFTDLMENNNILVQEAAVKGLCFLLLHKRVQSVSLLTRFLVKWWDPLLDNGIIRVSINAIIHRLPHLIGDTKTVEKTIFSTIKIFANASLQNSLSQVDSGKLCKFMLDLCYMFEGKQSIQNGIILQICQELSDNSSIRNPIFYVKFLLIMDNPTEDVPKILELCDAIKCNTTNKQVNTYITKFVARLNMVENQDSAITEQETESN